MDKRTYNKLYWERMPPEKKAEYHRTYYQRHKGERKSYSTEYYLQNREKILGYTKKWAGKPEVRIRAMAHKKKYRQNIRMRCIDHYSGGTMECACCPEKIYEFLTIDHINGGGTRHKKIHNAFLYGWLIKNNFPEGFRVLCMNCNFAIGMYGLCAHHDGSLLVKEKAIIGK